MTFKVRYSRKVYIGRYETFDIELTQEYDESFTPYTAMGLTQKAVEDWIKDGHIPPHSVFYRPDQKIPREALGAKEEGNCR
jgi:hypothetical protein